MSYPAMKKKKSTTSSVSSLWSVELFAQRIFLNSLSLGFLSRKSLHCCFDAVQYE